MIVFAQRLTPGVQYSCDSQFATVVLLGELLQNLHGLFKKQIVELFTIVPNQWIEHMRQGEHHVEIGNRQQCFGLLGSPLFDARRGASGTMPVSAAQIEFVVLLAMITTHDHMAELATATFLERVENFPVMTGQPDPVRQLTRAIANKFA